MGEGRLAGGRECDMQGVVREDGMRASVDELAGEEKRENMREKDRAK